MSLAFPATVVAPGVEDTQCVVKRLGNVDSLHVGSVHNVLGDASHHLIVYAVNDTVEQTTPFHCKPFTDTLDPSKGAPLMVTQKKDDAPLAAERGRVLRRGKPDDAARDALHQRVGGAEDGRRPRPR